MMICSSQIPMKEIGGENSFYGDHASQFLQNDSESDCEIEFAQVDKSRWSSDPLNCQTTKKRVSFSNVRVREHCLVIGDHPCCEALPLSLGWGYLPETVYDLDDFERRSSTCTQSLYTSTSEDASQVSLFEKAVDHSSTSKRLTYSQRKFLLKRVSGLSDNDLMRLERQRRLRVVQDKCSITVTREASI